jgi:hypothetical protein
MIAGFPQKQNNHQDTLSLMEYVSIILVICIRSERGTLQEEKWNDDRRN